MTYVKQCCICVSVIRQAISWCVVYAYKSLDDLSTTVLYLRVSNQTGYLLDCYMCIESRGGICTGALCLNQYEQVHYVSTNMYRCTMS